MSLLKEQQSAISTAELAQTHAEKAIDYAIRSGEHLINVKAELPHGDFIPWMEKSMPIRLTQCKAYMKIAKNKNILNSRRAAFLDGDNYSIRGALEAIKEEEYNSKAKEEKPRAGKPKPNTETEEAVKKAKEKAEWEATEREQKRKEAHRKEQKKKQDESMEDLFEGIFGIRTDIDDVAYKLAIVIIKMNNEEGEKKIFKLLKQYCHPDKGGSDELFKLITEIEEDMK